MYGAIDGGARIQMVVPHRVGTEAKNVLSKRSGDERLSPGEGPFPENHGYPQAGVLFQRSATVGLLLIVTPNSKSFEPSLV